MPSHTLSQEFHLQKTLVNRLSEKQNPVLRTVTRSLYLMKSHIARNIAQATLRVCGGSAHQESAQMIDKVLEDFVVTRTPGDIYWALHATHLYERLYHFNLKDSIKRINEILLSDIREFGSNRSGDYSLGVECKGDVIGYFLHYAPWDASPEEYGIDIVRFKDERENLLKLAAYPFPSKEDWDERQWRI